MNKTKKQHFVAATYLAGWDLKKPSNARSAKLWWTDGSVSNSGSAGNLAHQRYLYAQENTHLSEGYFGQFESDWQEQVTSLQRGDTSPHLLTLVMLQAVVAACRNPSLNLTSSKTRFTSTVSAIDTVINKVLLDGPTTDSLTAKSLALKSEWQMHVFRRHLPSFMSCDNPAILLSYGGEILSVILLPINPYLIFMAVRRRQLRIFREHLTEKEVAAVNTHAVVNSHRMVFSYEPFEDSQLEQVNYYRSKNRQMGELGNRTMRLSTLRFPIDGLPLPVTTLIN